LAAAQEEEEEEEEEENNTSDNLTLLCMFSYQIITQTPTQ